MGDRPILFSGAMVRAILEGRKTQTRRVLKPQPSWIESSGRWNWEIPKSKVRPGCCSSVVSASREWFEYLAPSQLPCAPGDRLWVRETWKPHSLWAGVRPSQIPQSRVFFKADDSYAPSNTPWVPAIHMPRWASRLTLVVTDVRVQRLQDIAPADAAAEGCPCHVCGGVFPSEADCHCFHRHPGTLDFEALWDSLNGNRKDKAGKRLPYAWADNPWVTAVTFTPHKVNIDQFKQGQESGQ